MPRNEKMKNTWLESLGYENIDSSQNKLFICSLHFEESCINRTLGLVRLYENAVPIQISLKQSKKEPNPPSTTTLQDNSSANEMEQSRKELDPLTTTTLHDDSSASEMESNEEFTEKEVLSIVEPNPRMIIHELVQPKTLTASPEHKKIQKLKERYIRQKKKIKILNQKCRRQAKKIADFYSIIQDLKNKKFINNEE